MASADPIQSPVMFEIQGIVGGRRPTPATSAAKDSKIGSIMREWNAWDVVSRTLCTPFPDNISCRLLIADSGPDRTHWFGALTAAKSMLSCNRERASASEIDTASIEPKGMRCMSRPRTATNRSASSSENTPDKQAATYSPTLCPSMP